VAMADDRVRPERASDSITSSGRLPEDPPWATWVTGRGRLTMHRMSLGVMHTPCPAAASPPLPGAVSSSVHPNNRGSTELYAERT